MPFSLCNNTGYEPLDGQSKQQRPVFCVTLFALSIVVIAAIVLIIALLTSHSKRDVTCTANFPNGSVANGWCATLIFTGLAKARGLLVMSNGDLLMVERQDGDNAFGRIWVVYPSVSRTSYEKTLLVENAPYNCTHNTGTESSCISHGIAYYNNYLYASSDTTVYRWKYNVGDRKDLGPYEIAVVNIPAHLGTHETRTLLFDVNGNLYISVGAQQNIDLDLGNSEIRRINFRNISSQDLPLNYKNDGELWAFGVRNEVGITFDTSGQLWGVEPGIADLYRADLGGDISMTNPSEELNLIKGPNSFYGYPYCFSEYDLPPNVSRGRGSQWAVNVTMNDGIHNDSWCTTNALRPVFNFPPHSIPLGLEFYYGTTWSEEFKGDLFIARHGGGVNQQGEEKISGYDVIYVDFDATNVIQTYYPILQWKFWGENRTIPQIQAEWHRFVNIKVGKCIYAEDCLFISSDNDIGYLGGSLSVMWRL